MTPRTDTIRLCTRADFGRSHEERSGALATLMDIAFDDANPRAGAARDFFRARGVALTGPGFTTRTGRRVA